MSVSMPVIPAAHWLRRQALDGRLRLLVVLLLTCVPWAAAVVLFGSPSTRWPLLIELGLGIPALITLGWSVLVGPTVAVRRSLLLWIAAVLADALALVQPLADQPDERAATLLPLLSTLAVILGVRELLPRGHFWEESVARTLLDSITVGLSALIVVAGVLHAPPLAVIPVALDAGVVVLVLSLLLRGASIRGPVPVLLGGALLLRVVAHTLTFTTALTSTAVWGSVIAAPIRSAQMLLLAIVGLLIVIQPPALKVPALADWSTPLGEWLLWQLAPRAALIAALTVSLFLAAPLQQPALLGLLLVVAALREGVALRDARRAQRTLLQAQHAAHDASVASDHARLLAARMLAGVVHDAARPMQTLHAVQHALTEGDSMESAQRLRAAVADLTGLFDPLKLFLSARARPLTPVPLDLAPLILDAVGAVQPQALHHNVTIAAQLGDGQRVMADPVALRRVLENLLSNAVRASGAGAKGEPRATTDVSIVTRSEARTVLIEVANTGQGIALRDQQRIFEPHVSGSGSLGLGLTIVRDLVHGMGGTVGVISSDANVRTIFWVRLLK